MLCYKILTLMLGNINLSALGINYVKSISLDGCSELRQLISDPVNVRGSASRSGDFRLPVHLWQTVEPMLVFKIVFRRCFPLVILTYPGSLKECLNDPFGCRIQKIGHDSVLCFMKCCLGGVVTDKLNGMIDSNFSVSRLRKVKNGRVIHRKIPFSDEFQN